jgi:trehalose synthase-fused probable maltokinase
MTYDQLPLLISSTSWESLFAPQERKAIEALLPTYLYQQRWFGAKARQITATEIVDLIPLPYADQNAYFLVIEISYSEGDPNRYALVLLHTLEEALSQALQAKQSALFARVHSSVGKGVLLDGLHDLDFAAALLSFIDSKRVFSGEQGSMRMVQSDLFAQLRGPTSQPLPAKIGTAEQSNTSVLYGDRLIMKLFRRVEPGINPELEIGRFLTNQGQFGNMSRLAAAIEYLAPDQEPASLAVMQSFVPNRGDAWSYTLSEIVAAFERAKALKPAPLHKQTLLELAVQPLPEQAKLLIGPYQRAAARLGELTAQFHRALAADPSQPDFAPEPMGEALRQQLDRDLSERARRSFQTLQQRVDSLPQTLQADAHRILQAQDRLLGRIHNTLLQPCEAKRIRIHGDYHLGQVLYTGSDFVIIDFEGEPARSLEDRRRKSSPLQDVAGMLRSFHYAPYAVLMGQAPQVRYTPEELALLEPWAAHWHAWVSGTFLSSYLQTMQGSGLLPSLVSELQALLDLYILDKALYELLYELNNRPTWVRIPLEGVLQLGL